MTPIETVIIKDLFKSSNGLFIYTMYHRYNTPPKDLFLAIEGLKNLGYVVESEDRVEITTSGKDYVINTNITSLHQVDKFSKIPIEYLGSKISINEFYLPKSDPLVKYIVKKDKEAQ